MSVAMTPVTATMTPTTVAAVSSSAWNRFCMILGAQKLIKPSDHWMGA